MSTADVQGAAEDRRVKTREAAAVATCVEINQCRVHPIILHEVVMNRHRHAIERRVDGVEGDATIQYERAVTFDFHTGRCATATTPR